MAGAAGKGRPKGSPNKSSHLVREAIAAFAQANVGKMTEWINSIEDPAKKMDLYLRAIEYHVPKLARTEVAGDQDKPVIHRIERVIVDRSK